MPTDRQFSVMFARFPARWDHPDVTDWLVQTAYKAKTDPRIGEVRHWRLADTPVTMTRNRCIKVAQNSKVDFLVLVDDDMAPDLDVPGAKPFWDSTIDFMIAHYDRGPCVVASPYCGPPPHENVYIFRWATYQSEHPNPDMRLEQYGREEAAQRAGFEQVAALPTGLMIIDMRAIDKLTPPYFYYEWSDETESEKASTEDVTFTRDLALRGVPIYCNWDAWAGHWKWKCVKKPHVITLEQISEKYQKAIQAGQHYGDKLIMVGEGDGDPPAPLPALREDCKHALDISTLRCVYCGEDKHVIKAAGEEFVWYPFSSR